MKLLHRPLLSLIVTLSLFTPGFSFAQSGSIKYLNFEEVTQHLAPKEVEDLKKIFDQNRIIDLESSNLSEFSTWLEEAKTRLTQAVEKKGMEYPFYRIYISSAPEVNAGIYKYRPSGQAFYRGHVFISISLIQQFVKSLGASHVRDLSSESMDLLLKALLGILAHEFAHPKEDEIVKWDWRARNDRSRQNHAQADEMATDLIAMSLLREAGLSPEGILYATRYLPIHDPSQQNPLLSAGEAGTQTHPETELRINITRGYLTQDRMDKGFPKTTQIPFQENAMKSELDLLMSQTDVKAALENEFSDNVSKFQAILKSLRRITGELKGDFDRVNANQFDRFLAHLDYLSKFKLADLTSEDQVAFMKWIQDMDDHWPELFSSKSWFIYTGSSGSGYAKLPEFMNVRLLQRKFRKIEAFQAPAVREFVAQYLVRDLEKEWIAPVGKSIALLTYLPANDVMQIQAALMQKIESTQPLNRVDLLLTGIVSVQYGNGPAELEIKMLDALLKLLEQSTDAQDRFVRVAGNFTKELNSNLAFHERFARTQALDPKLNALLVDRYAKFARSVFGIPRFLPNAWDSQSPTAGIYRALLWEKSPAHLLQPIGTNTQANQWLLNEFNTILQNKAWSEAFTQFVNQTADHVLDGSIEQAIPALIRFLQHRSFSSEQSTQILFDALVRNGMKFEKKYNSTISYLISRGNEHARLIKMFIEKFPQSERMDILREIFKEIQTRGNASTNILDIAEYLKKNKLISSEDYGTILSEQKIPGSAEGYVPSHSFYGMDQAYSYWRHFRENGMTGAKYLKEALSKFDVEKFDETTLDGSYAYKNEKTRMRALKQTGMRYHPSYASLFHYQVRGIMADFQKEIMLGLKPGTAEYSAQFKKNFNAAANYIELIFNPDQKIISNQYKKILDYSSLDKLAMKMVRVIPSDLSHEQHFQIWTDLSAKRVNKYTDQYFMSNLLKSVSEKGDLKTIEMILKNGLVRSERVRIDFMKIVLAADLKALAQNKGKITDKQANDLLQRVQYYTTDASRFRDQYLEDIAWKLQLNERQLKIFIEPLKSFNYKAIDVNLINMLSSVSVLMQSLTTKEKLDFVLYIQNPVDSIFTVLPRLSSLIQAIAQYTDKSTDELKSSFEKLESIIRDAGETEKLVMIESIVGTREHGLWFKGADSREELYKIAKLEGTKRKLFETYLKALPEWEHSMVISYLLATANDIGESDILSILELFQTPGLKFAQMASIFNIFGDEESAKLAKAKSKAKPPTRASIFELLRERLSDSDYKKIKSIDRLLGSGSIKYVVSVTLEDGRRFAVYLRRPFIEESTATILDIAEQWMKYLKQDPELKNFMDYDYYLASLRDQLEQEIKFSSEAKSTHRMAGLYEKRPAYQGWSFKGVRPEDSLAHTDEIYHYQLVENVVEFDKLSPSDQKIVGEYLLKTELDFIFAEGDADRHLGNYLFDPVKKWIYPLDMGQHYTLKTSWFRPDESYAMAKVLYALTLKDRQQAAEILFKTFDSMRTSPALPLEAQTKLKAGITEILASNKPQIQQVLGILAELNNARLRVPFRITLGMIKGLSIVLNEDYAKAAGPKFLEKTLEARVKELMIAGKIKEFFAPVTSIEGLCNSVLHELGNSRLFP